MSTERELIQHRDSAGERYAAAVAELRAAYADLCAIDRLLTSNIVASQVGYDSFGGGRPDPIPLRHPKYAPDVGGSFEDDVVAAFAVRARAYPKPDAA